MQTIEVEFFGGPHDGRKEKIEPRPLHIFVEVRKSPLSFSGKDALPYAMPQMIRHVYARVDVARYEYRGEQT